MAFTYVSGSTTDATRVRFNLGDTDENRSLFDDAEIGDLLAQESDSVDGAVALGAEILALRYARDFDFTADGSSFKKGSVSKMYSDLAVKHRALARGTGVIVALRVDGYSDDITADAVDNAHL
jgi:hypothetical protein